MTVLGAHNSEGGVKSQGQALGGLSANLTLGLLPAYPSFARNRRHETVVLPTWNEDDDLCLSKKSFQRDYPRDLTEFEARFANEPACPGLPVPTALARGALVSLSSEE